MNEIALKLCDIQGRLFAVLTAVIMPITINITDPIQDIF